MFDDRDIVKLLDIARDTLRAELLEVLPADKRHAGLMIANALSIASRYVGAGAIDASADDQRAQAAASFGEDAAARTALHEALLARTRAELAIANPKALPKG